MTVAGHTYLGIETGATHTTVMVEDGAGRQVDRFELGPANVLLSTDGELERFFLEIKARTGEVSAIGAGMAGLRNEQDRRRVDAIARVVWPETPFQATNDLETALTAAGEWPAGVDARVLLLSGTGSCAYGRDAGEKVVKFGGRGHILGDRGSACDISLGALRNVVYQFDVDGRFPALGHAVLAALQLNEPDDLIPWIQEAEKHEIAALAVTVFRKAEEGDALAKQVLHDAADKLADMAVHCAERLSRKGKPVQFVLAGSVLLKQPAFAAGVGRRLGEQWEGSQVVKLVGEGVQGALALARALPVREKISTPPLARESGPLIALSQMASAPTEWRNPRTMELDSMPLADAIGLLIEENAAAVDALKPHAADLEWMISHTVEAFRAGRRLFYVGAGTSGRLGVLDASECPPTFRVPPELVQGIMAGGRRALWSAVEGAEDQEAEGAEAVRFRGVGQGDVILGIAASGRTPYVWGALEEARRLGAVTALLAFHPGLQVPDAHRPDRLILVNTGPEPLTGSTRMKAGTATKVFLNTLTTLAMVRTGKVRGNLMIDLNPSNTKLRDRAVRLVTELVSCDGETARRALEESGWVVRDAVERLDSGRSD
ncbi:N-acetylmuramic acid 6-phosphate etherase [Luteolibacter sp. SL250]|uniref:N-acetylmuramic acid 6-phosphate etherase n=1 Tax=Luteolibacter sp. SL250 TaxID=2995170 RepID=UPI002270EAB3|nr:N-acetylmuramic acid 6-phosphate etherase [Luteolibacter sp. SL250]WAC19279.1 N-acetylmuramic acid 6-phosphate etherase [Luteolibacter sp. SL250]